MLLATKKGTNLLLLGIFIVLVILVLCVAAPGFLFIGALLVSIYVAYKLVLRSNRKKD
jgi:hypothetical protein